jgi:hypothetical protein
MKDIIIIFLGLLGGVVLLGFSAALLGRLVEHFLG